MLICLMASGNGVSVTIGGVDATLKAEEFSLYESFYDLDAWTNANGIRLTEEAHSGRYSYKINVDKTSTKLELTEAQSNNVVKVWVYDTEIGGDGLKIAASLDGADTDYNLL